MKSSSVTGNLKNHGMAVRALSFTASSQNLVSAGDDLHIFVTDSATHQRKHTMVGHSKQITSIACHPHSEDLFMTSSLDGTIKMWNMLDSSKAAS